MPTIQDTIELIYEKYRIRYGFPQGFCGQIACEIKNSIGGEVVAGYLKFSTFKREHWWVEKDGEIIDPMSDELKKTDKHEHIEVHRDMSKAYWKCI